MTTEKKERKVEELMLDYTRVELDDIAASLNLVPSNYPNKRTITYDILKARALGDNKVEPEIIELEDTHETTQDDLSENILQEILTDIQVPEIGEVIAEVKMMSHTVRGKIHGYKTKANEFNEFAKNLNARGNAEMKAGVAEFNESLNVFKGNMLAGVSVMQDSIQKQAMDYRLYRKTTFADGVNAFREATNVYKTDIHNYVKSFYG